MTGLPQCGQNFAWIEIDFPQSVQAVEVESEIAMEVLPRDTRATVTITTPIGTITNMKPITPITSNSIGPRLNIMRSQLEAHSRTTNVEFQGRPRGF